MYIPKPIDTKDIALPKELLALTETIASDVHEKWSESRIAEGWVFGETKDSIKKTTPLLVHYEELSENEKNYDRITALHTLKIIAKLGYSIKKAE